MLKTAPFVAVQNENIIFWKKDKDLSYSIQLNTPLDFLNKIEQKCKQETITFVKIPKYYLSTQICSKCQKRNPKISGKENLHIINWECPHCHTPPP